MVLPSSSGLLRAGWSSSLPSLMVAGVGRAAGVGSPGAQRRGRCRRPTADPARGPRRDPGAGAAGRLPLRAGERGYLCNTRQVAHQGTSGGFKALRYTDRKGNTCAYYDSTLLFPRDVASNLLSGDGLGVVVLDMNDPSRPRRTDTLVTPTMLTPHESLLVNKRRGLLVAEMGTAVTLPGILEIYDVKSDCRHPKRLSTTVSSLFGHESGFAPDGKTFYASGTVAGFAAIDVSDPRKPRRSSTSSGCSTTACGCPTTAAPCTPPTSASPGRAGSPAAGSGSSTSATSRTGRRTRRSRRCRRSPGAAGRSRRWPSRSPATATIPPRGRRVRRPVLGAGPHEPAGVARRRRTDHQRRRPAAPEGRLGHPARGAPARRARR